MKSKLFNIILYYVVAKTTFPSGSFSTLHLLFSCCFSISSMHQPKPQHAILLQFIDAEVKNTTTKCHCSGNNIFIMHCHLQFKEYTYQQQKLLFIYRQKELQPRHQHTLVDNYSIIHRVGTMIIWRGLSFVAMMQAYRRIGQFN
jgi:hypothetical protein